MSPQGKDATPRLAMRIVRLASRAVPAHRRADWLEEWESELWHWWAGRNGEASGGKPRRLAGFVICLGAIPHGLWEWRQEWTVDKVWQDFRFALRLVRRSPAFTLIAVATLPETVGDKDLWRRWICLIRHGVLVACLRPIGKSLWCKDL